MGEALRVVGVAGAGGVRVEEVLGTHWKAVKAVRELEVS